MILHKTQLRNTFDLGAEKPVSQWNMDNSWVPFSAMEDYPDFALPSFYKDVHGFTRFGGLMASGTVGNQAFTLPLSHVPTKTVIHYSVSGGGSSGAASRFDIRNVSGAVGQVKPNSGSNTFYSLEGAYVPTFSEGLQFPILTGGWSNFGVSTSSEHMPTSYYKDSFGFVHLFGLIRNGSLGSGNPMFTLPEGFRPEAGEIFTVMSNGAFGEIRVESDGKVYAQTGSTSWFSLAGCYFMASTSRYASRWKDLSLQNSWANYGSIWQTAQYFIDPAGLLHIRGRIKSGTTTFGTEFASLPSEAGSPRGRRMMRCSRNGTHGAFDFDPEGVEGWFVRSMSATSTSISGTNHRLDWTIPSDG